MKSSSAKQDRKAKDTSRTLSAALSEAKRQLAAADAEKQQLEKELRDFREYLDRSIYDRTAELSRANKNLRAEIMRRIQMEKELVESQRFVSRITEATPNLLYIYDVITDRCIYINQRATDLLGFGSEALKKMTALFFRTVLHPEDSSVFDDLREKFQHAAYKDTLESEYRMKNAAAEWRWFHSRNVIFRKASGGGPQLILGIAQDITERKKAEEELNRSREQLRILFAHQQTVREEERTRISREIHDELGQSLTALKLDLSWLLRRLTKDQAPLLEKVTDMSRLIDMNIQTVKRIAAELRPGLLDDLGLTAALEWQAEEFEQRQGISCELRISPDDISLEREISTAIFRIFQETLTNVVRHAHARKVSVNLRKSRNLLTLSVRDDGRGITKRQIAGPTSIGLIGMRERVGLLGGKVSISGAKNRGTLVRVTIPLQQASSRGGTV